MSISSELNRIIASKSDIADAITEQGVTTLSTDSLDTYSSNILSIGNTKTITANGDTFSVDSEGNIELGNISTTVTDTLTSTSTTDALSANQGRALKTLVDGKVSAVSGKGLSTNDYTTAEKTKLAGIATGAEVNVQANWTATSGDAMILNKPTIPTTLPPNGTAGGDLSGSYPNPSVKDNSHMHTIANVTGLQTALNAKISKGESTEHELELYDGIAQYQYAGTVYTKTQESLVSLCVGVITTSAYTRGTAISSMPAGFRPSTTLQVPAYFSNGDVGMFSVSDAGAIRFYPTSSLPTGTYVLATISYVATN